MRLLPRPTAGRRHGYLILELTLAMVIISIALVGLLNGFRESIRAQGTIDAKRQTILLLEGKINELEIQGAYRSGVDEGICQGQSYYRWETEITETEISSLYRAKVTVLGPRDKESIVVYLREKQEE